MTTPPIDDGVTDEERRMTFTTHGVQKHDDVSQLDPQEVGVEVLACSNIATSSV